MWGVFIHSMDKVTEGSCRGQAWVECPLSGSCCAITSNIMLGLTVHLSSIWLF
jgi:hypothetical protein